VLARCPLEPATYHFNVSMTIFFSGQPKFCYFFNTPYAYFKIEKNNIGYANFIFEKNSSHPPPRRDK